MSKRPSPCCVLHSQNMVHTSFLFTIRLCSLPTRPQQAWTLHNMALLALQLTLQSRVKTKIKGLTISPNTTHYLPTYNSVVWQHPLALATCIWFSFFIYKQYVWVFHQLPFSILYIISYLQFKLFFLCITYMTVTPAVEWLTYSLHVD